jgi:hypothetical protein
MEKKLLPHKLTKRSKRALVKDEKAAATRYKKLGFSKLAKDERSHAVFLRKQKVK